LIGAHLKGKKRRGGGNVPRKGNRREHTKKALAKKNLQFVRSKRGGKKFRKSEGKGKEKQKSLIILIGQKGTGVFRGQGPREKNFASKEGKKG